MTFYVKLITQKFPNDLAELIKLLNSEIENWNELDSPGSLHEFLGMPETTYFKIVTDQSYLKDLRNKTQTSVFDLIEILKTLPQDKNVVYDSVCDLYPSDIIFDSDFNTVRLNF